MNLKKYIKNFDYYFHFVKYNVIYNLLFFYKKLFLKKCGKKVFIHPFVSIKLFKHIKIGNNVKIHRNCVLWGEIEIGNNVDINPNTIIYGKVVIKDNVMIAPNCSIINGNHNFDDIQIPMINQGCYSKGKTILEEDVWIGANSVILDGVKISKGCIIGAGSVVTKSTEPYGIYVGSPAKLLRKRK